MNPNSIKEKLTSLLIPYNYKIFSIKRKHEFGENIVEILLTGSNINTDALAEIHVQLFELLDDNDINPNYFLEISSRGAEYPLENLTEIKEHVGKYVYVDAHRFKGSGELLEVTDNTLELRYNAKGQFRKIKIEYDTINLVRTSVKI